MGEQVRADWKLYVLKAVAAGLCLRFLVALLVDYGVFSGDERGFRIMAENLYHYQAYCLPTREFPTCLRPPLFPFFVSCHYFVFGIHRLPVQITQFLLSLVTAGLLALATERAINRRTASVALWLACLDPYAAMYAGRYLAETLASFLLVTSVASLILGAGWKKYALAGLAMGLACLTRDGYLLLMPILPLLAGFADQRRARIPPVRLFAHWMLYAACAALVIGPWSLRNYRTFRAVVPVSRGNLGFNLWVGTWERTGAWQSGEIITFPTEAFDSGPERARVKPWTSVHPSRAEERDRFFMALAKERWSHQPLSILKICLMRSPRLWIGTRTDLFDFRMARFSLPWYFLKLSFLGFNLTVLALAFFSLPILWRRHYPLMSLMLVPILYTQALYFVLHNTETRYSQPVFPFLLALASVTWVEIVDRKQARD